MTANNHPLFAHFYHRMRDQEEKLGVTEMRRRVLAGLRGRVLEIGAGDGANFPLYPSTVTELVALEPEPHLRAYAVHEAGVTGVPVTVLDGVAEDLPFPDGDFDAVVCVLVLCSVRDQRRAAAEMYRVLRPGGEVRFLEHVRADGGWLAVAQHLVAPVQARFGGGCHPDRDTLASLRHAGLDIDSVRHFEFYPSPIAVLDRTRIEGVARRPA